MTELYRSPGNLDDDIRMLNNTGAKCAGRTIYLWGREARIADPKFLAQGREMVARIHKNHPDLVQDAEFLLTEGGMQWAYSELFQNYSGSGWPLVSGASQIRPRPMTYTKLITLQANGWPPWNV